MHNKNIVLLFVDNRPTAVHYSIDRLQLKHTMVLGYGSLSNKQHVHQSNHMASLSYLNIGNQWEGLCDTSSNLKFGYL